MLDDDPGDDSGAASVLITTMLKCRREDTTTGVGAHILKKLSETRSAELAILKYLDMSRGPLRAVEGSNLKKSFW